MTPHNIYPRGTKARERGTWTPLLDGPRLAALFVCPTCGTLGSLIQPDHTIGPDGRVDPSVVCMHDGCTFHEFVTLDGWSAA